MSSGVTEVNRGVSEKTSPLVLPPVSGVETPPQRAPSVLNVVARYEALLHAYKRQQSALQVPGRTLEEQQIRDTINTTFAALQSLKPFYEELKGAEKSSPSLIEEKEKNPAVVEEIVQNLGRDIKAVAGLTPPAAINYARVIPTESEIKEAFQSGARKHTAKVVAFITALHLTEMGTEILRLGETFQHVSEQDEGQQTAVQTKIAMLRRDFEERFSLLTKLFTEIEQQDLQRERRSAVLASLTTSNYSPFRGPSEEPPVGTAHHSYSINFSEKRTLAQLYQTAKENLNVLIEHAPRDRFLSEVKGALTAAWRYLGTVNRDQWHRFSSEMTQGVESGEGERFQYACHLMFAALNFSVHQRELLSPSTELSWKQWEEARQWVGAPSVGKLIVDGRRALHEAQAKEYRGFTQRAIERFQGLNPSSEGEGMAYYARMVSERFHRRFGRDAARITDLILQQAEVAEKNLDTALSDLSTTFRVIALGAPMALFGVPIAVPPALFPVVGGFLATGAGLANAARFGVQASYGSRDSQQAWQLFRNEAFSAVQTGSLHAVTIFSSGLASNFAHFFGNPLLATRLSPTVAQPLFAGLVNGLMTGAVNGATVYGFSNEVDGAIQYGASSAVYYGVIGAIGGASLPLPLRISLTGGAIGLKSASDVESGSPLLAAVASNVLDATFAFDGGRTSARVKSPLELLLRGYKAGGQRVSVQGSGAEVLENPWEVFLRNPEVSRFVVRDVPRQRELAVERMTRQGRDVFTVTVRDRFWREHAVTFASHEPLPVDLWRGGGAMRRVSPALIYHEGGQVTPLSLGDSGVSEGIAMREQVERLFEAGAGSRPEKIAYWDDGAESAVVITPTRVHEWIGARQFAVDGVEITWSHRQSVPGAYLELQSNKYRHGQPLPSDLSLLNSAPIPYSHDTIVAYNNFGARIPPVRLTLKPIDVGVPNFTVPRGIQRIDLYRSGAVEPQSFVREGPQSIDGGKGGQR